MMTATSHRRGTAPPTATFSALDHDFELVCDDPQLADYLEDVLGELRRATGSAHRYELCLDGGGSAVLTFDGEMVCADDQPSRAIAMLFWHINREAVARTRRLVRLHAGGVVGPGGAVLLPGAMESGKSTLTAALVRAGLGYLSDELLAIDERTRHVVGFPRAISLDPGSWPAFADVRPRVDERTARLLPPQWQVPPDALRRGCVVRRARPALIIAPTLTPGTALAVETMRPADTFRLLASATFGIDEDPARDVPVLGHLASSCPAFAITFSDVDAAVDAVFDILGRG